MAKRYTYLTQGAFASKVGISRQTVNAWVKQGKIQLVKGKIDYEKYAAASPSRLRVDQPKTQTEESAGESNEGNYDRLYYQSRAAKEYWAKEIKRLEALELAGKLIAVEKVEKMLSDTLAMFSSALLSLPIRVSSALAKKKPEEIVSLLEIELKTFLQEQQKFFMEATKIGK